MSAPVHEATISSTATGGVWSQTTTWTGGVIPGPLDNVTISDGATVTVNGNFTCNSLTFFSKAKGNAAATGTLIVNTGNTLTVTTSVTAPSGKTDGTFIITGAGTVNSATLNVNDAIEPAANPITTYTLTSTINTFNVSGNLNLGATNAVKNEKFNNPVLNLQSGTLTVGGTVTVTTIANAHNAHSSAATLNMASGTATGTLVLSGATPWSVTTGAGSTLTITLNGTGSTVNYSGSAQTVYGVNYTNLTLSGSGAKTIGTSAGGTLTSGILNIDQTSSGTATASVTNNNITVQEIRFSGNIQAAGTWGYSNATNKNTTFFANTTGYLNVATGGIATKYIVSSDSSSPAAGSNVTITAQLADAGNNAISTIGNIVTWSKSDVNGSFATATSTTNASGIATVVFTTHTVSGTSTTVTGTDAGSLTGTSGIITTTDGAATITSARTGNWSKTTTWVGGVVPVAGDAVTIATGHTVTVDGADACASITVAAGAATYSAITISGTNRLTVSGTITINAVTKKNKVVSFAVGTGTLNAANIILAGSANEDKQGENEQGEDEQGCALTVSSGTINVTGDITFSGKVGSPQLTFTGAGTLNLGGNLGTGGTFTKGTGTVTYNGGSAQTVGALSYNNLTMSGAGTKNAAGSVTVGATLTNGSTLDMAGFTLTLGTTTTNTSGTIRFSGATNGKAINSGRIEYYGTLQTVATGTYYNLTLSGSGAKTTISVTVNSILTIAGTATASAAPTYNGSSPLVYAGDTAQTTGSELPVTMVQPVIINNSNGVVLSGATTMNGTLTFTAGNLSLGSNNLTLGGTVSGAAAGKCIVTDGSGGVSSSMTNGGSFLFPVGPTTTTYNPVSITNNTGLTSAYTARVAVGENPPMADSAQTANRTWTLSGTASGGAGVNLAFTWNTAESGASISPSSAVAWEHNGVEWIQRPGGTTVGTPNVTTVTGQTSLSPWTIGSPASPLLSANIKVFLQGPYSGGAISTSLKSSGLIPLTQPYNTAPWNYAGIESVESIPADVVDWILVELRTGTADSTIVATRAGFLRSNGTIVDVDSTSQLVFSGVSAGNYYVVVRHRNHLAIMSAAPVALSDTSALYDFTTAQTQAYGTNPMKDLGGGPFGMVTGDTDASGAVVAADRNNTWNNRNITGVYSGSDTDLSGTVVAADRNNTWNNRNLVTQVPN